MKRRDREAARLVSLGALCVVLDLDPARPRCPRCYWPLEWCEAPTYPQDPAAGLSVRCRRPSCVLEGWAWAADFVADALRVSIDEARRFLLYAEQGLAARRRRAS
jgi:hypothetical protein